ncbi:hypothetical protein [Endozoicomonas sp.]|uniref:hypothetical protein n=1 Tax=Endozoicomonas sp. TaxID=1892382 RepID=UPI00383BD8F6
MFLTGIWYSAKGAGVREENAKIPAEATIIDVHIPTDARILLSSYYFSFRVKIEAGANPQHRPNELAHDCYDTCPLLSRQQSKQSSPNQR